MSPRGPIAEARLEPGVSGQLRPVTDGWFVVGLADVQWVGIPWHSCAHLEGTTDWEQYGFSVDVIAPGRSNAVYHRERGDDESFLVLDGAFDAVIEGEQFDLEAGDFVHCPAGQAHGFVASGLRPGVILMLGRRTHQGDDWGEYVPDPRAAALGIAVAEATTKSEIAYAGTPEYEPCGAPPQLMLDRSARREDGRRGLRPTPGGGFILHVDDAQWLDNGLTARCLLDRQDGVERFEQYGVNVQYLRPGQPNCRYHREFEFDETMLALDGSGVVLVEGEERPVRAGDVIHCPAGTGHVFVASPDHPLVLFLLGTRDANVAEWGEYPADERAATYGASVETTTPQPEVAYVDRPEFVPAPAPWPFRGV